MSRSSDEGARSASASPLIDGARDAAARCVDERRRAGGHDHVAAQHEVGARRRRCAPRAGRSGCGASRTWLVTAPFFCARPVKSSTLQPLPSRCAAMPSSAPTVMTPVPPMPVTRMPYGAASGGSRRHAAGRPRAAARGGLARARAAHGDEARAEALDAGEVLVARRLVDRALAAELGLERLAPTRSSTSPSSRRSPRRPRR